MPFVITQPVIKHGEARHINALFEAGLQRLHLRKPDVPEAMLCKLMDTVDERFYPHIAWHQCHHLAIRYGSRRLHIPERVRLQHRPEGWKLLAEEQCILSTSIHAPVPLADCFSYAFTGPVFDSISKPGYRAGVGMAGLFAARSRVALGGITADNCNALRTWGVQHIAVSGAVWQYTDPVAAFLKIKTAWHIADPLYSV